MGPPVNAHPPLWTYTAYQHPCPSAYTDAHWPGHLTQTRERGENYGLPPSHSAPLLLDQQRHGGQKGEVVAMVRQGSICVILEAEPRAGSPLSLENRDSQPGGHSGSEEAVDSQTCCPDPHLHPWVGEQALLPLCPAAMTPSVPSH